MDELDENDPFIKGYEYSGDIYLLQMAMAILSLVGGAADGIVKVLVAILVVKVPPPKTDNKLWTIVYL